MPEKGFFASLFDISFASLITPKVIKAVYVLTLVLIGLLGLAFIVAALISGDAADVVFALIVVPVASLFYAVYARVLLEFVIAVFRIMETNVELVALQRQRNADAPPASAVASDS
jgi:NADH:ubiquinone oxidoreductase subunit K